MRLIFTLIGTFIYGIFVAKLLDYGFMFLFSSFLEQLQSSPISLFLFVKACGVLFLFISMSLCACYLWLVLFKFRRPFAL